MKNLFPGMPGEGIAFLRDLKAHNDREWFNPRKPVFEEKVRRPMLALIAALHGEMLRFAPEYAGDPAKCLYRIYRDTRFSKNKAPYKTYTAALFWRRGMVKDQGAAFYFGISGESIDIGCGLYAAEPAVLNTVRRIIAANPDAFRATFESRKVKKLFGDLGGAALSRIPRGFDAAHPAADLLKRKQYLLWSALDPAHATTPRLFKEISSRFEAAAPFVEFLNRPLIAQEKKRRRDEKFLRD